MLQIVDVLNLKPKYRIGISILVFLILILIAIFTVSHISVEAQETEQNLSEFLNQLKNEDKTILIQFNIPLVADEKLWILPDQIESDDDEISRFIADIGEDYICFDELAGQAFSIRCTPFTNIVSISYLNQPE